MSQNTPNVQPVEKGEFDGHVYFLEGGKPEVAGMLHEILKDEKGMLVSGNFSNSIQKGADQSAQIILLW